jgi:hypothetical protein
MSVRQLAWGMGSRGEEDDFMVEGILERSAVVMGEKMESWWSGDERSGGSESGLVAEEVASWLGMIYMLEWKNYRKLLHFSGVNEDEMFEEFINVGKQAWSSSTFMCRVLCCTLQTPLNALCCHTAPQPERKASVTTTSRREGIEPSVTPLARNALRLQGCNARRH